MILRQAIYLLTTSILLFPAQAMDNGDEWKVTRHLHSSEKEHSSEEDLTEDWEAIKHLEPVTVHIWPSQDNTEANGHVAVETTKYYMSFRGVSEKVKEEEFVIWYPLSSALSLLTLDQIHQIRQAKKLNQGSVSDRFITWSYKTVSFHPDSPKVEEWDVVNWCPSSFAPPTSTIDQFLQDIKLNGGSLSKGSKRWPYKTVTLHLKAQAIEAMHEMWEMLLKDASSWDNGIFTANIFSNVYDANDELRKHLKICTHNGYRSYDNALYFTNTTMVLGLLGKGGIFAYDVCYIGCPKYFANALSSPFFLSYGSVFTDPIKENFYVGAQNLGVKEILGVVECAFRCQALIRILKILEDDQIPFLTPKRRDKIAQMESHTAIENYLSYLKTEHERKK